MIPQREILWNVPPAVMTGVYVLSALCMVWIVAWFLRRERLWRVGHISDRRPGWWEGVGKLARYLVTHRTLYRDPFAGWMHALIFWGFVVLLVATTLVGIQHHLQIVFLTGTTYLIFSLAADLGGLAFSVGVAMALWRRRRLARPRSRADVTNVDAPIESAETAGGQLATRRLLPSRSTTWMLWLLLALSVTGFLVEGARIARDFPSFEIWSPVGFGVAELLAAMSITGESAVTLHRWMWIVHAVVVIIFFVIVPLTLLRHIIIGAYSVARPAGRPGVLAPSDATHPAEGYGNPVAPVQLRDFRRFDLLQADACLTCGRCNEVCPATAAGKPLQPRSIVLGLREHLDRPEIPLVQQVQDDALWSCTTCNACDVACPIDIHIVEKIVTLRRGRVAEGAIPDSAIGSLESAAQKFNPFDGANSARMEWATGLDVPVAVEGEQVPLLYWVGCGGAFDPAGREVARAMVHILNHLNMDYRVLGCRERCTGDPARRLGEERLFQELAQVNQQTIADHRVETILTHCPHCFNSLRNEYPATDPMPNVMHHSQWLRDRLQEGTLSLGVGTGERLTFHDPCYLSRANDEVAAPRAVLDQLSLEPPTEMSQHGSNSFCCGGGGGQLWLDVRGRTRVENIRASHVEQTGAQTVATACPFCRVMLEAGRSGLNDNEGKWRVKDIAELVVESL